MITDAGWENYFNRQDGLAAARQHRCPIDGRKPGYNCLDRWGQPTSAVHPARSALAGYVGDPYPLDEGPGIPRVEGR